MWLLIDRTLPSFLISAGCKSRLIHIELLSAIIAGLMVLSYQRRMPQNYATMSLNFDAIMPQRTDTA